MDFKEFHNLKGIKEKDLEPGDAGILVHEGEHIINDINLGKTRAEIHQTLTTLLPGFEPEIINEYTDKAMALKLDKSQLKDFAEQAKSGLKLESMDTSAIQKEEPKKDFVERVSTPTISSPNKQQSNETVTKEDEVR